MRYGIFSDIHGNLQALEVIVRALKKEHIDRYLCVGDIIGYGANPQECIKAVVNLKAACVAGNHDWAILSKVDIQYFNPMAAEAVYWTRENTTKENKDFLENLELVYKDEQLMAVHGTLSEPEYFDYLMDRRLARETFTLMDRAICFVGHSHIPGIFVQKQELIAYASVVDITLEEGCRYIVNTGSVGQPRDGSPMAAYCVFDSVKKNVCVKRVNYDIEEAQRRILLAGLPPYLASRLSFGR
ncbi:MAG: metallophosphoesterase family protein [Candidatus Omnitrophota bacterium]